MTEARKITVGLGDRSYPILVGHNILDQLAVALAELDFPHQIAIITNDTVNPLYAGQVRDALTEYASSVDVISIPDGENYKTLSTLEAVFTELIEKGIDRSCGLLALGGGVVGDLAGFAAASYLRGVPFVQIPTTLLAQVDSSVGGKTAVNHALGKNLIGAFYQPQLVLIDVALLSTLPERELRSGLAEVVKYGIIKDLDFFNWLEKNVDQLISLQPESLIHAIMKSCQIKANIVETDEKESSLRAILNYGHTFGHAVEQLTGYGAFRHGEAVAIGMLVAARVSLNEGLCQAEDVARIDNILRSIGLPVDIPPFPLEDYLEAMARDKKVHHGTLRYVLNCGLGDCQIRDIESPKTVFSRIFQTSAEKGSGMSENSSALLGKIAAYTEILAKDSHSTVFVALSEAYRKIGMLDDALEIALKGTANMPGFCPGFTALGRVFSQQGELTRAAEAFERAIELEDSNLLALKGLAKVRHRQGFPEQASIHLARLLELNPADDNARALLDSLRSELPAQSAAAGIADLNEAQSETLSDSAEAETPLSDSDEPQPIPTETVADLYRKQGLLKEAAAIYRDILRIDPQRDSVRHKLVEVKQLMENTQQPAVMSAQVEVSDVDDQADVALTLENKADDKTVAAAVTTTDSHGVDAEPVSTLERWLVSIEKRRAHVR
jgi:3-dehydroquinate synthase